MEPLQFFIGKLEKHVESKANPPKNTRRLGGGPRHQVEQGVQQGYFALLLKTGTYRARAAFSLYKIEGGLECVFLTVGCFTR